MLSVFYAFGFIITLMSSVAAFNATRFSSRAQRARLPWTVQDNHIFSYSSVDHYEGKDFLNDS